MVMQAGVQHARMVGSKMRVYYEGSDTLYTGYGLCFNADRGTITAVDHERYFRVEKPSITNNYHFAGVVTDAYNAFTGPGFIDIWLPGSVCGVRCNLSVTGDTETITLCAGQYYFSSPGFHGKGSAKVLQTLDCATTEQAVQAYLHEGVQSGLVEIITPPTTGATFTVMVGGVTYLIGVVTIGTGDHVGTLADGSFPQQDKAIICTGTFTAGNEVDVNITHHMTSDPEHRFYDAAGDQDFMVWNGYEWTPKVIPTSADAAT